MEVKTHGESYLVQAWNKGASASMDFEKNYTLEQVLQLESHGKTMRKPYLEAPNLLSLSQVLRLAGNYVDRARGQLIRVSWQDQSDKIQSVTIQYQPFESEHRDRRESQIATIEELCIHVYKQKKRIAAGPEKHGQRPFVSVNPAG